MAKKSLAIILCMAVAASLMTGCGGADEKAADQKPAENKTDEAGGQEEEPEGEKAEDSKETVTLKVFDAHAYGLDEYGEMAAKFEEEHPGVKIEVQHAANDNQTLLQSRVNSGDIPDVFDVESGTSAQMYFEYAYDWTKDQQVLDLFHEDALQAGKDEDGNVKSLPWVYDNMGILYNKECFEKAGITELPVNLTQLEEACKKLEAAGIVPFALGAKENWVLAQLSTHFMMDKSLDAAGTNEALLSGKLKFEDLKNWKNLFAFLDLAVEYGPDKPLEVDWEASENMLANGDAAMIHMGDWCQGTLDSFNPDAQIAFMPCPVGETAEDATLLYNCDWVYIVNKDSQHLDLAKEYVQYILTSEMGQYWICEGVGSVPACVSDKEVKGKLSNDAKKYIEEGKTNGWIHTIAPNGFADVVGPYLQAYMTGDMTAEEVTQAYQEFWSAG